jgi:hypothetical protein
MRIDDETLLSFPRRFAWSDVVDRDRFDDRFGAVNAIQGAIMDVTQHGVELSTDGPITRDELIAWVWLVRPDLAANLREVAAATLRATIDSYSKGTDPT